MSKVKTKKFNSRKQQSDEQHMKQKLDKASKSLTKLHKTASSLRKKDNIMPKETKTYYLGVETFDRYDTQFETLKVQATSIKDAVVGFLDDVFYDETCLTIDGENGRYAGEECTIGIGITEEAAALQYVKARMENG